MSLPASTANANTLTALNAITAAADTNFIANVDAQIASAIALGQYQVTAVTNPNVDLATVYNYYMNLGYAVTFPDYLQQNGQFPSLVNQPVNFFGFNWTQYWLNIIALFGVKNPARMTFSWI